MHQLAADVEQMGMTSSPRRRQYTTRRYRPNRRLARVSVSLVFLSVIALVGLLIAQGGNSGAGSFGSPPPLGAPAPDFTLQAVRGGSYSLTDLRGHIVLLSFIRTERELTSDQPDPSRSQLVFLKSMYTQYSAQGVHVLLIAADPSQAGRTTDELINFTYDHNLPFPLLVDDSAQPLKMRYGIRTFPTTFLIDGQGQLVQRWDGFASAASLAFALQEALGTPSLQPRENRP